MESRNSELKQLKKDFYILSLWLLFLLIIVMTINIPISFDENAQFIGVQRLCMMNIVPLISVIYLIRCFIIYLRLNDKFKGTAQPSYEIEYIKDKNYDQMSFLTTYIIPLICLNLSDIRYQIAIFIILIAIGAIFLKMKLYLANPTLLLMAFHLYDLRLKGRDTSVTAIAKGRLRKNMSVQWIRLDENTWFVKELKKK